MSACLPCPMKRALIIYFRSPDRCAPYYHSKIPWRPLSMAEGIEDFLMREIYKSISLCYDAKVLEQKSNVRYWHELSILSIICLSVAISRDGPLWDSSLLFPPALTFCLVPMTSTIEEMSWMYLCGRKVSRGVWFWKKSDGADERERESKGLSVDDKILCRNGFSFVGWRWMLLRRLAGKGRFMIDFAGKLNFVFGREVSASGF